MNHATNAAVQTQTIVQPVLMVKDFHHQILASIIVQLTPTKDQSKEIISILHCVNAIIVQTIAAIATHLIDVVHVN
jgi:hypothetical protein